MEPQPTSQNIQNAPQIAPVNSVIKSKTNWAVSLIFLFTGVLMGIGGILGYQYLVRPKVKNVGTSPTPVAVATPDPTANWKTYNFSPSISIKLPTEMVDPKYVNAGHYAVQTTLAGGTYLQIWGADGASPTGGKDFYTTLAKTITNNSNLKTNQTSIDGHEATAFTGENISFQSGVIWGGSTATKLSGLIIKISDGRALVVTHYQDPTSSSKDSFQNDEVTYNQILSTFKFTDQNQGSDFDSLNSAARSALISHLGRTPTTEYGVSQQDTKISDNWAFGIITIYATGEGGPDLYYFLGKKVDSKWQIAIEGSRTFKGWVSEAPEGLINPDLKKIWVSN